MLYKWTKKIIDKRREKKRNKYPRKRRVFEHEAEPVVDQLYMKHRIHSYEIKEAVFGEKAPLHLRGKRAEVLFYNKIQCEVQLAQEEQPPFFIPTDELDFSPILYPNINQVTEGQYVRLLQEIESDDEEKETLGEEGEEYLLVRLEPEQEYPFWLYHEEIGVCFRAKKEEFQPLKKRIAVEIL